MSPTQCLHFSCILVVRCEYRQGKVIYLVKMRNRSVVIDRMANSEEQFYTGSEQISQLAYDNPVVAG